MVLLLISLYLLGNLVCFEAGLFVVMRVQHGDAADGGEAEQHFQGQLRQALRLFAYAPRAHGHVSQHHEHQQIQHKTCPFLSQYQGTDGAENDAGNEGAEHKNP